MKHAPEEFFLTHEPITGEPIDLEAMPPINTEHLERYRKKFGEPDKLVKKVARLRKKQGERNG